MNTTLAELLQALPSEAVVSLHGDPETVVSAPVVEDTRQLEPGGVFVARRGLVTDGHRFISAAAAAGAVAVVGEDRVQSLDVPYVQVTDSHRVLGELAAAYHGHPSRQLIVIGVTGTDGKTTTSTLLHSILNATSGVRAGYISTLVADLGDQQADTGFHVTTPGAPDVQAYLAQMVRNGVTHCVMEMTSHGLAQGRLQGVDIDVAVLTNLTHEHLDYHGTFENYRAAKGIMFQMLSESAYKTGRDGALLNKAAVVNGDDPNVAYFESFQADEHLTYAVEHEADWTARNRRYEGERLAFDLHGPDGTSTTIYTTLLGDFNAYNIMAAWAAASHVGADEAALNRGVEAVVSIPGRMERIDEGQGFVAMVDFAHTPHALENALRTVRRITGQGGRVIAVFGSAGLRDREKRHLMARTSAELADYAVLTAEDPRTESLDDILAMMAAGCEAGGGVEGQTFRRVPDRGEAIYHACQVAQPGDVVIVCGKGHEQSMCFIDQEYPWDDRDALRAALKGVPLRTLPTAVKE